MKMMDTLQTLKQLSRSVGTLREMVHHWSNQWHSFPAAFEDFVARSVPEWIRSPRIPIALRILMGEVDSHELRLAVCRACEPARCDPLEKVSLLFVAAMWGEENARQSVLQVCEQELTKAVRSSKDAFTAAHWALRREAMLGYTRTAESLDPLLRKLREAGATETDCGGTTQAVQLLSTGGSQALSDRLNSLLHGRKPGFIDIECCFLLGAARESGSLELFRNLHTRLTRTDFWTQGLQRQAIIGLAYGLASANEVRTIVEEVLVTRMSEYTKKTTFFGPQREAEFMLLCSMAWNYTINTEKVRQALRNVAAGSNRNNANYATALLALNGESKGPLAYKVKFNMDFLQYDMNLNFSYYWRCRPPRNRIQQAQK